MAEAANAAAAPVAAQAAALLTAQAAPNPQAFALMPAMVGNRNNPFDWTRSSNNQKLYHKAVDKLSVAFKGKSDQVLILLGQAMLNIAIQSGWNVTLMTIPNAAGMARNIITDYGRITYEEVLLDCANINVVGAQHTRTAQQHVVDRNFPQTQFMPASSSLHSIMMM